MVADCFVTLCKSLNEDLVKELLPVFVKLLSDSEQEVSVSFDINFYLLLLTHLLNR